MANWPEKKREGYPFCPEMTMSHWIKRRSFPEIDAFPARWCAETETWSYIDQDGIANVGKSPEMVDFHFEYQGPCKSPSRGNQADKNASMRAWWLREILISNGWTQEARQMQGLLEALTRSERKI